MIKIKYALGLLVAILLMPSVFLSCSDDEDSTGNDQISYRMLPEDDDVVKWYYTYYTRQEREILCTIFYSDGLDTIQGKEYHRIRMDIDNLGSSAASKIPFLSHLLQEESGQHVLDVREEDGRLFAPKSMYISFLRLVYQVENPFLIPASDGQEVMLYDLNVKKGQSYPCLEGVKVESVQDETCYDGSKRKVLILSNGMKIMEGVGCINSTGGPFAYQNASLLQHETSLDAILATYEVNERWIYKVVLNDDFTPIRMNERSTGAGNQESAQM